MQIEKYTRRNFEVDAVQITLENIDEVAEWCGGRVEKRPTRLMATTAMLPVISLKGTGVDHGNYYIAYLNCWIVKMGKTPRMYKPDQFEKTFMKTKTAPTVDDIMQMIEDSGFELYGYIRPAGEMQSLGLSAKVNSAIDQALQIAKNELDTHNTECEV